MFQGENFPPSGSNHFSSECSPRVSRRRKIEENKTFPKTKTRRLQWIISLIKAWRLIHVWCANQPSIQRVAPRVVGTLNRRRMSILFFAKSRPAVTANVVKGADRRSLIFRDDQAFAGYFRKKIIAGFSELALMADQHPIGREYLLQLFSKNLRRNKIALRQRLRAGLKSRGRFAKLIRLSFGSQAPLQAVCAMFTSTQW